MKKQYIFSIATVLFLATGCSKENPFDSDNVDGEGKFMKSALSVDLKADEMIRSTRADVNLDDFNILFYRDGSTVPAVKYKYGEMPDVVVLPAGTYTCAASYGENRNSEWESPYYLGESEAFDVKAYEITSYIEPIECTLENIKVSIEFDADLRSRMSADSYVEVRVGDSSALSFTKETADAGTAGYFRHIGESTLVATFYGTIDGVYAVESKSYKGVEKGNHYKLTFKYRNGSADPTGDADLTILTDAHVDVVNVERNVPIGEDDLLDDSERPREGEDPVNPVDQLPVISAVAPVNLDKVNNGNTLTSCVLNIHSYADGGIQEFTCDIESPTLTPEELQGVGLASHLDLAETPDNLAVPLSGLGFPINVRGQKDVCFDITKFLPMLGALGEGEHHFVLKVSDANGTTEKVLKIKY